VSTASLRLLAEDEEEEDDDDDDDREFEEEESTRVVCAVFPSRAAESAVKVEVMVLG